MSAKEMSFRLVFFLLPWLAFSALQFYVLKIHNPYAIMLYGGAAALVCISVRDGLLELTEK